MFGSTLIRALIGNRWNTSRRRRGVLRGALTAALVMTVLVGTLSLVTHTLDGSEFSALDSLFNLRRFVNSNVLGRQGSLYNSGFHFGPATNKVVLVVIDENTYDNLGRALPSRTDDAIVVNRLHQLGAKVIALDLSFSTAKPGDQLLGATMRRVGHVFFNLNISNNIDANSGGQIIHPPAPDLYGIPTAAPNIISDNGVSRDYTLINTTVTGESFQAPPYLAARFYGMADPARETGNVFYVNYIDDPGSVITEIPFWEILHPESISSDPQLLKQAMDALAQQIRGNVVFVGATFSASGDLKNTPLSSTDNPRPGVEILAYALNSILEHAPVRHPDWPIEGLILLLVAIISSVATIRLPLLRSALLMLGLMVLYLLAAIALFFTTSIWINIIAMEIVIPLVYFAIAVVRYLTEEREKNRYRNIFSRYVARDVVNAVLESSDDGRLNSARSDIAVLFSDIRGFTTLSESLPAEQVVNFLNKYFELMAEIVFRYHGTLDKYVGDAVMALFGAPNALDGAATQAVMAAIEMQQKVDALRAEFATISSHHLAIGIGVNYGSAVVGTLGSGQKVEYTAIGDTVNVASRLESLNKEFEKEGTGIIVSQSVADQLPADSDMHLLGEVHVKGRTEPVQVYAVARIGTLRVPLHQKENAIPANVAPAVAAR